MLSIFVIFLLKLFSRSPRFHPLTPTSTVQPRTLEHAPARPAATRSIFPRLDPAVRLPAGLSVLPALRVFVSDLGIHLACLVATCVFFATRIPLVAVDGVVGLGLQAVVNVRQVAQAQGPQVGAVLQEGVRGAGQVR